MSIFKHIKPTRIALITLVSCLVASAVIGITIVLIGDFGDVQIKILATVGVLAGLSIISLPSLFNLEKSRYKLIAILGFLISISFFVLILLIIWGGQNFGNEIFGKSIFTNGIIAFAINHILLIFIVQPKRKILWICQKATTLIICAVALLILAGIWTEDMPETIFRILVTLAILDVLGTISLPILSRINSKNA